jgi:hypothetical protein
MFHKLTLKIRHSERDTGNGSLTVDGTVDTSWKSKFRQVEKTQVGYWFWDHFNWENQSLWIGKLNKLNHLPSSDDQINKFLNKLISDLDQYKELKTNVYIKFYFSRNTRTHEPDINYILICDSPKLPEEFEGTLIGIMFEQYQLTPSIINSDQTFKSLINHYLNWSNFYTYYDLMGEIEY